MLQSIIIMSNIQKRISIQAETGQSEPMSRKAVK